MVIGNQLPQSRTELLRRVKRGMRLLVDHLNLQTAPAVIRRGVGNERLPVQKNCARVRAEHAAEELGERGVKVAVGKVAPQIALCFEGCPADDTFTEPYAIQTALKKGPMLRFMDKSIVCSPRYQRYVLDLAEEKGLAVQSSVREGGGNNGAIINTSLDGIPVIVVGVPVRYIHSPYGITSYYDFEATVQLATEVVRSMTEEIIRSF